MGDGAAGFFVRALIVVALLAAAGSLLAQRFSGRLASWPGEPALRSLPGIDRTAGFRMSESDLAEELRCEASDADDPVPAVDAMIGAARAGDVKAEYATGLAYLHGEGVPCNLDKAFDWLSRAADDNFAAAEFLLGALAELDRGPDPQNASSWYMRAAGEGNLAAMNRLGVLYLTGRGVEHDYDLAESWFEQAARRGYVDAEFNLALIYETGAPFLAKPSLADAYFWYSVAASLGDEEALERKQALGDRLGTRERETQDARIDAWTPAPHDRIANGEFPCRPSDFLPAGAAAPKNGGWPGGDKDVEKPFAPQAGAPARPRAPLRLLAGRVSD